MQSYYLALLDHERSCIARASLAPATDAALVTHETDAKLLSSPACPWTNCIAHAYPTSAINAALVTREHLHVPRTCTLGLFGCCPGLGATAMQGTSRIAAWRPRQPPVPATSVALDAPSSRPSPLPDLGFRMSGDRNHWSEGVLRLRSDGALLDRVMSKKSFVSSLAPTHDPC